jgi:hyperosmotically inducible protein
LAAQQKLGLLSKWWVGDSDTYSNFLINSRKDIRNKKMSTKKINKKYLICIIAALLISCSKSNTAEEAGHQVDKSLDNLTQSVKKETEKAQNNIQLEKNDANDIIKDSLITAHIKMTLLIREGLSSGTINVSTSNGLVTLSGSTSKIKDAELAVNLTKSVKDVVNVKNEIKIIE